MNNRDMLKIALLPGILIMLFITLFYWRDYNLSKLNNDIAFQTKDLSKKQKSLRNIKQLQEKLDSLDSKLAGLKGELIGLSEPVAMVKAVAALAESYDIVLIDYQFDVPKYIEHKKKAGEPGPFIVPFEGKFKGDFIAAGKFIKALERKAYLKEIYNIKLLNDPATRDNILCNVKGAVRFFDRSRLEPAPNG